MATTERETRVRLATARVERRAAGEGGGKGDAEIVGHAATFDEWTTIYDGKYYCCREIIRPGAFRNAIKEKQDVRCLFNHDANFVLGRTKSGTCELSEDKTGLLSRTVPPDSQTVRDLVITPMERGDIDGMSFAFSVRSSGKSTLTDNKDGSRVYEDGGQRVTTRYEGDREVDERELLDLDLYDVSPVVFPAYEGTDCGLDSRSRAPGIESRAKEKDVPHTPRASPAFRRSAAARLRLAEAEGK